MNITWNLKKFDELSPHELYAILQLRNEVFAVEQNCVYADMDNKDQPSWHLMGFQNEKLIAYTRIIPPGIVYPEPSVGRVVTSPAARKTGVGKILMNKSVEVTYKLYGKTPIKISAQHYLLKFYTDLGFIQTSDIYPEDGIEHIEMMKP
jgi:ElaA protein